MVVPRQVLMPRSKIGKYHSPHMDPECEIDINISQHHRNIVDHFMM